MSELLTEFGKHLRALRQNKKMSQEELALKAGISPAHLGQIERAEKNLTLETAGKLSAALKVSLSQLFSFEEGTNSIPASTETATVDKINAQLNSMTPDEQKDILRIIRIFRGHTQKMAKKHIDTE